jgi:hypothetical protein
MASLKFYILNSQGQVLEIRTKMKINGQVKFLIEKNKGNFKYVSESEFNYVPAGLRLVPV